MGVVTRAKKRRMEAAELLVDLISDLPDDILGDIVSLLPTKAGARTRVLSSRWRHIWRSAPLNLDPHDPVGRRLPVNKISRMLSTHSAPRRRFSIPNGYFRNTSDAAGLNGWLRSPALKNLQELEVDLDMDHRLQLPPSSVHRFSSTLRVASFSGCSFLVDGKDAGMLRLPVLKQMTFSNVNISESSLHALLAGCTVLQSLLLYSSYGFSRLQIVSPSLRSIGVRSCRANITLQLIIEDTPCLERLLIFEGTVINVSLISAPRLCVLGKLFGTTPYPWLQFQSTVFQGSTPISAMNVVHSVMVLALSDVKLSLDAVIDTVKCFPRLEKLYIKATRVSVENVWFHKYQKLIGTHDIRLRKIVLANYQGSKTHIKFVRFFLSNARVLESVRLESKVEKFSSKAWIARQRSLLDIKRRASMGARITFIPRKFLNGSLDLLHVEQVHDLSIDPFERFHQ